MYKKTAIATLSLLLIFSHTVFSQKKLNSPYSRFNIGTLEPQGSYKSRAMGGIGVAMRDNSTIYYMNPASYSSLDTNSFTFDFGFDLGFSSLKQGDEKASSKDMNFNHLIMGFPLAKKWGMAIGLVPVSHGYYNIAKVSAAGDADYDSVAGSYSSSYKGSGNFSKAFVGTGANIYKGLSVGVNMTVMFGTLTRNSSIEFADLSSTYQTTTKESMGVFGINFDVGLQYAAKIKDDYFLNAGLALVSEKSYKSKYTHFSAIDFYAATGFLQDTLINIEDSSMPVKLPNMYKAGVAFGKTNKFVVGVDFAITPWSDANIPGPNSYVADSKTLSIGAEFIPEWYSAANIFRRLEYRAGAHIGDNYLSINGSQIKEKGASFGVGIPLRRTLSKINLFVDYSQRSGAESARLHEENVLTVGGSLNLHDFWFFKRRYN